MSKLPDHPQIAIHFYGPLPSDEKFFILMDIFPRYPIGEIMKNASAQFAIKKSIKIFSMFGYPKNVIKDNKPPFQRD